MNRCFWPVLLLVLPGLVGCTPPGPREFYRSALQAQSEFVDSLSHVVDEKTAKDKFKVAEKVMNDRLADIKDALGRAKYDNIFRKLNSENFNLKNVATDDRDGMINGIKEYASYCRQIVLTNVRLKREIKRLTMVSNMEALTKAREQKESNQPVTAKPGDFPNLSQMLDTLRKPNAAGLRFVPADITKENLKKLNSNLPEEDLAIVVEFTETDLDAKARGITPPDPPPLPEYPAWAIDIDQRYNMGLTKQRAAKKA